MTGPREIVKAPGAPAAIGPYSHAVCAGGLLFCSGQIPLDPNTDQLVGSTAAEQARRCLENLQAVCAAADASLADAVRLTIYMTDLDAFAEVNEVYATFFSDRSACAGDGRCGAAAEGRLGRDRRGRGAVSVVLILLGAGERTGQQLPQGGAFVCVERLQDLILDAFLRPLGIRERAASRLG